MKRVYNNICQCCKNEFEANSHNKKYCKNCEGLINKIEYEILPQEIKEDKISTLKNYKIDKFKNNSGGIYFWININLKDYSENIKDDFIVKLFYYKCDNCNNYYHINNLKGRVNKIINAIENNQTVTCSRKCQNQLKAEIGMNFVCKYCDEEFLNKNPRIHVCDKCTLELDSLYENIFPKVIKNECFKEFIKDKNIVENYKNESNGEYFIFNYNFKNKILNFIYKKCVVCNDLIRINDHIDRFLNDIKNNNCMTFCSNIHQNQYLNEYKAKNNLIKCICKKCKKEFYSNNYNTYYCEDCNKILNDIYNEINYNENGGIYNDWFLNNKNNIEIIEEFRNDNNSEYKIIIYKGFEIFLKKCDQCNKCIIQDHYDRTIKAIKDGNHSFCSNNCRDKFYNIGYSYLLENQIVNCNKHENCTSLYFYESLNKYICWECFKEKFEEDFNFRNNNNKTNKPIKIKYINKNQKIINKIQCKQCNKIINLKEDFCSEKCKKIYKEDYNKYFKRNNQCEKHLEQIYTYHGWCLSCYIEQGNEIPNICKCRNCGKLIDPYQIFCNDNCKVEYTQSHKSIFKEGNSCEKHSDEDLIYGQICWSCYQEYINKFINLNKKYNFLNEIKIIYNGAFIQKTYRTQKSKDWSGARLAFEQDLVDKNITWFTYVKFYINDKGQILPLVVGKSGSKLVNVNGSDVNFSKDVNDGPARRFLKENNYQWDKTKILIVPVNGEKEALKIEKEIHDTYNLFYS